MHLNTCFKVFAFAFAFGDFKTKVFAFAFKYLWKVFDISNTFQILLKYIFKQTCPGYYQVIEAHLLVSVCLRFNKTLQGVWASCSLSPVSQQNSPSFFICITKGFLTTAYSSLGALFGKLSVYYCVQVDRKLTTWYYSWLRC